MNTSLKRSQEMKNHTIKNFKKIYCLKEIYKTKTKTKLKGQDKALTIRA